MTTAYRISCPKCKRRVESSENHTWGRKSLKGLRIRLLKIQTFITSHYIILTSLLYRVQTLMSHNMENPKIAQSPHILGRLNACTNSVYRALLRFSHTPGDKAMLSSYICTAQKKDGRLPGNEATFIHHAHAHLHSYHFAVCILLFFLLWKMLVLHTELADVGRG